MNKIRRSLSKGAHFSLSLSLSLSQYSKSAHLQHFPILSFLGNTLIGIWCQMLKMDSRVCAWLKKLFISAKSFIMTVLLQFIDHHCCKCSLCQGYTDTSVFSLVFLFSRYKHNIPPSKYQFPSFPWWSSREIFMILSGDENQCYFLKVCSTFTGRRKRVRVDFKKT